MLMNNLDVRVVMHDTISTDETPQNENAASRSARHDIAHSR